MNTDEAIKTRRSIKHYDPAHRMTDEEINRLLSLAVLSPTAFNIQNWRYVVVNDRGLRKKIRAEAWDQAQVTDASLFIVLCADLKAWEKEPARYWRNTSKEIQDFMVPAIDGYYRGKQQVQRDEAMRSCGIAAQTLMLAAKSMGYDSCPMDGFDFDKVAELIKLPDDHVIAMFVAIGKGTKEAWPRPGQLALDEVVLENSFSGT
jgi:nitroreductase